MARGGSDVIYGLGGDDLICGNRGNDFIWGLAGDDAIFGNRGDDYVLGGAGNDRIYGGGGSDRLGGSPGNDRLDGGSGPISTFFGDAGDDAMTASSPYVNLEYFRSPVPLTVRLRRHAVEGWGSDRLRFPGVEHYQFIGSDQNDTMYGSPVDDDLYGDGGTDLVVGRGGDDVLGSTFGLLRGGPGNDTFLAAPNSGGELRMVGGDGADRFEVELGQGIVEGDDGDDITRVYLGTPGADTSNATYDGGPGNDWLETYLYGPAPMTPPSPPGHHHIAVDLTAGSMSVDALTIPTPGFENFTTTEPWPDSEPTYDVAGTDGPNTLEILGEGQTPGVLSGRGGDDTLVGSLGNDTLDGGDGDDTGDAGPGTDVCSSIEHATNCESLTAAAAP